MRVQVSPAAPISMFLKEYISDLSELDLTKFDDLLSSLPQDRINKIKQYKQDNDINLSLLTGLVINKAFAEINKSNLAEEIAYSSDGKPLLPPNSGLFISISHSGTKAYVVISDHDVGCDIEYIRNKDYLAMAKRFFSEGEYQQIVNQNITKFYQIWTVKESYLKLIGKGLKIPLNSFEVDIDKNTISDSSTFIHKSEIKDGYALSIVMRK